MTVRPWPGLRLQQSASEADIQAHVVTMLRAYLPPEVRFGASLSGVKLTAVIAFHAKRQGLEPGWPDLGFIITDGPGRGQRFDIEMKSATGTMTADQKVIVGAMGERAAVCRSWDDVRDVLDVWMAKFGLRFLTPAESIRMGRKVA